MTITLVIDLCGTLVQEDTTRGFVSSVGLRDWRLAVVRLASTSVFRKLSNKLGWDLSRALVLYALRGIPKQQLCAQAERYVDGVLSRRADPRVLEAVRKEVNGGGQVFLATASIEHVAHAVALRLGLTGAVSSELAYDSGGCCTGRLAHDLTGRKWSMLVRTFPQVSRGDVTLYTDNNEDLDLIGKASKVYFIARSGRRLPRRVVEVPNVHILHD